MAIKTQQPKPSTGNLEEDLAELRRVLMYLIAELNFLLTEEGEQ